MPIVPPVEPAWAKAGLNVVADENIADRSAIAVRQVVIFTHSLQKNQLIGCTEALGAVGADRGDDLAGFAAFAAIRQCRIFGCMR